MRADGRDVFRPSFTLRRKAPLPDAPPKHAAHGSRIRPISKTSSLLSFFSSFLLHDDPRLAAHGAARCAPRPPRREARGGQRGAHGNRRAPRRERTAPRAERRGRVRGGERHQDRAPRRGRRSRARGPLRPDGPLEADREERGRRLGDARRVRPRPHAHESRPPAAHDRDLRQHGGRPLHRPLRRRGRERAHGRARPAAASGSWAGSRPGARSRRSGRLSGA